MDVFLSFPFLISLLIVSAVIVLFSIGYRRLVKRTRILERAFNLVTPICVTSTNYEILTANDTYWSIFGAPKDKSTPLKCYDHRPGAACHTEKCPLEQILSGKKEYVCYPQKELEDGMHYFIVTARPFYGEDNEIDGVIEAFQDITQIKKLEHEKEALIEQLQESLSNVKQLSGLIPICASCKKVRDDKGFWSQVEAYITDHSEAMFSHGMCPECTEKAYKELREQQREAEEESS